MDCVLDWESWHSEIKTTLDIDEHYQHERQKKKESDIKSLSRAIYCAHVQERRAPLPELNLLLEKLEQDKANCLQFYGLDGISLILYLLCDTSTTRDICVRCCHIVSTLAELECDSGEVLGRDSTISILNMLRRYEGDVKLMHAATRTLRKLSVLEDSRSVMLENGIFELITSILQNQGSDEGLVESALALVALVVYGNNDARVAFGKTGGIPLIVSRMFLYESSTSIQLSAAIALRNLAFECSPNVQYMRDSKALEALFHSLKASVDSPEVQNESIAALGNILAKNEECRNFVLSRDDFIEKLYEVACCSEDASVCVAACAMLRRLCSARSPARRSDAQRIASVCMQNNGLENLAAAVAKSVNEKETRVVVELSELSSSLCCVEEIRSSQAIRDVLRHFLQWIAENMKIEQAVSSVLHGVSSVLVGNDGCKELFSKTGGFAVIQIVLNEYFHVESIVEECCKVLDLAADGQSITTKELITDPESVASITKTAIERFPRSSRIQEYAISTLVKIAGVDIEQKAMLNTLCITDAVLVAMSFHSANPAIESQGNQLLATLRSVRSGRSSCHQKPVLRNCRSRSRTIGDRARSRNNRSTSPHRDPTFKAGREAMLSAKAAEMATDENGKENTLKQSKLDLGESKLCKATKMKLPLEPVYE